MGFPPPFDAPSVPEQQSAEELASFTPTIPGVSLCGFAIPGFSFNLSFRIPNPFGTIDFPPVLSFSIALKCDLDDPIDTPFGGGRTGTLGLTDDGEYGPDG